MRGRERGNASIEFIVLAVVLLVPMVYAVVTALTVERAAYAVTAATREAGRVYVRDGADDVAYRHAFAAASLAMRDQGLELRSGDLQITCDLDPCGTAGNVIHIRVDRTVELPLVPALGRIAPAIAVHGRHDEVVDCFGPGLEPAPSSAGTPCL